MHANMKLVLPALALFLLTVFFLMSSNDLRLLPPPATPQQTTTLPMDTSTAGFLVHTPGCRIPFMNAFDPGLRKYVKHIEDILCSSAGPLVLSNQTSLWLNPNALPENFSVEDVTCCYSPIWRKVLKIRDEKIVADSQVLGSTKCTEFKNVTEVNDEFVKVTCFHNSSKIYRDYHAFVSPKKKTNAIPMELQQPKPSVLMIGVDAVSRLNFYRQMPRTLQFLQSHKAIEFVGYNKVDDNTFPNLVPVLAGKSVEEIQGTCWKNKNDFFDDCPFIWKNFRVNGYQTGFGEDACWMGIFQYLKKGFFQQPVDNYLHTMMTIAEDDIGHTKKMNAKLCVGPRPAAQVLFEYAEKFATSLNDANKAFFGLFWGTSLTHDFLNVQPQTDVIYETLMQNLKRKNVFNNTVIIFMSDHGIRWGPIRETYQGRVEERLPLLYFLLPAWFQEKYSTAVSNLKRNSRRLTSPFDLHETLVDLLSLSGLSSKSLLRKTQNVVLSRGISLFLPVPETRTCEDAGITENWCTCHQSQNISIDNPIVLRASLTVVDHLNQKLFPYIQCAQLALHEVKSALLEAPRAQVKSSSSQSIQDVTVLLVTTPGLAEFEATVRHYLQDDILSVQGYVSRINTYGSQSKCVDNFHMRLYCYCS